MTISHLTMLLMQWSERDGTSWSSSQYGFSPEIPWVNFSATTSLLAEGKGEVKCRTKQVQDKIIKQGKTILTYMIPIKFLMYHGCTGHTTMCIMWYLKQHFLHTCWRSKLEKEPVNQVSLYKKHRNKMTMGIFEKKGEHLNRPAASSSDTFSSWRMFRKSATECFI